MSTRACIIIHKPGVYTPKGAQLVKIYNHYDGYPEWLGVNLIRGFRNYSRERDIKYCIRKADYLHQNKFEITPYIHGDTEFLYHVYFGKRSGEMKITVQGINSIRSGDEDLIKEPETEIFKRFINKGCMKYPEWYGEWIYEKLVDEIKDRERYNVSQLMEDKDLVVASIRFEISVGRLESIIEWYKDRYEREKNTENESKLLDEILEEISIEKKEDTK